MHRTHAAAVKLATLALVQPASGVVPQAARSNRNQRSDCNQRGVRQGQPGLRRVGQLLGFPGLPRPEVVPEHRLALALAVAAKAGCRASTALLMGALGGEA